MAPQYFDRHIWHTDQRRDFELLDATVSQPQSLDSPYGDALLPSAGADCVVYRVRQLFAILGLLPVLGVGAAFCAHDIGNVSLAVSESSRAVCDLDSLPETRALSRKS